jgi:predicted nuclease of predicted toxin-antitoxin system
VRLLIDEMFPVSSAQHLRQSGDHEAEHVSEVGLSGAGDPAVAAFARAHELVVVTENVADFARMEDLVLVFVLKRHLPAGGAQAAALASLLRRWATEHPRPYVGQHWPT